MDIVVVGAGPAGMSAAIAAAERNARVVLLVQHKRPGIKLLLTGGSKCNISNTDRIALFVNAFGAHRPFIGSVLKAFGPDHLKRFFAAQGLHLCSPDGFHLYPESNKAADVLSKLRDRMNTLGVRVAVKTTAESLSLSSGRIAGVVTNRKTYPAMAVILATGGLSRTADISAAQKAIRICSGVGHEIIPTVPALVGLRTVEPWPETLRGISLDAAELRIEGVPKPPRQAPGILFTHNGISGPAVLNQSGEIARALMSCPFVRVRLVLDFKRDEQFWREELLSAQRSYGARSVRTILRAHMPEAVANTLCNVLGIGETRMGDLTKTSRVRLSTALGRGIPLTINRTEGFAKAMGTSGGVSVTQVNSATMESTIIPGLYFAGEILDVIGPCGGYNLQWAFSSGFLAGSSAAKAVRNQP